MLGHAGRELSLGVLRYLADDGRPLAEDDENSVKKDEKHRITIARALRLRPNHPSVTVWLKAHNQLVSLAHYTKARSTQAASQRDALAAANALIALLWSRTGPFFGAKEDIERLLAVEIPTENDIAALHTALTRPAIRWDFFRRLENPGRVGQPSANFDVITPVDMLRTASHVVGYGHENPPRLPRGRLPPSTSLITSLASTLPLDGSRRTGEATVRPDDQAARSGRWYVRPDRRMPRARARPNGQASRRGAPPERLRRTGDWSARSIDRTGMPTGSAPTDNRLVAADKRPVGTHRRPDCPIIAHAIGDERPVPTNERLHRPAIRFVGVAERSHRAATRVDHLVYPIAPPGRAIALAGRVIAQSGRGIAQAKRGITPAGRGIRRVE